MKTNIELAVVYQKKAAFAYWNAEDSREIGLSSISKAARDWLIQDAITWQDFAASRSKRARVLMGIESDELNEYERWQLS